MSFKFLVMAGGTGGHIYPALAVAQKLVQNGHDVAWLGSKNGMEESLLQNQDFPLHLLSISGIRGKGILGWLQAPFRLLQTVLQAKKIMKAEKVDAVVGFGGFASGPGGLAAILFGKPLLIHEQNAVPGLTNRVLAKMANVICQAFPGSFKHSEKLHTTGNPLRASISVKTSEPFDGNRALNLLIVGGSRGAQVFNQQLPALLSESIKAGHLFVKHQTGKNNQCEVEERYRHLCDSDSINRIKVLQYIEDMNDAYQWADLMICRAGALTVSEVQAVKMPAVFVPYPYAVDDHQTKNAEVLVKESAAKMVAQNNLHEISGLISRFLQQPKTLSEMTVQLNRLKANTATYDVANLCQNMLGVKE